MEIEQIKNELEKINQSVEILGGYVKEISPHKKELLTMAEAMSFLHLKRTAIDQLLRDKTLKAYRLKRKLYFKRSEIMEAVENGLVTAA